MPATPDLVAGRYRLIEPLAAGGMGRVWRARDESLGRDVAVKEIVPPGQLLAEERDELRRRTLREARAAARLSHPSVVRVYDVFETEGRLWIVMEYVPSRSLHDVLAADGPLAPARAAAIGLGLLGALRAAHRAGVLHRDIKPSNVLLCDDGRVVLTDFGIATLEGDAKVTRSGLVLGSPAYIAPERARENAAGPESDLWSLGATLYAAVEGHSPYERPSVMATLTALASEEPDPPRRAGPLEPVLTGLLRKDPAARMPAAEAERLLRQAAHSPGVAPDSPGTTLKEPRAAGALGTTLAGPKAADSPSTRLEEPATADSPGTTSKEPATADSPGTTLDEPRAAGAPGTTLEERAAAGEAGTARDEPASASRESRESEADAAEPATATEPSRIRASARVLTTPPSEVDGTGTRRRFLIATAAAGLVVLFVAGLVALNSPWSEEPAGQPDAGGGATSQTPDPEPGASAAAPDQTTPAEQSEQSEQDAAPALERPELPDGWRLYTDETGFSVYVPEDWQVSREGTLVYFRGDGRTLGIDQSDDPQWDPVADWTRQRDARLASGDFPGYDEVRLEAVDYGIVAADWEFTFDGSSGARQHVNNRGVVVSDDKAYGFWWQTTDADWDAARSALDLVFDSFRPLSDT
jgi:serine/threonine protein kinase